MILKAPNLINNNNVSSTAKNTGLLLSGLYNSIVFFIIRFVTSNAEEQVERSCLVNLLKLYSRIKTTTRMIFAHDLAAYYNAFYPEQQNLLPYYIALVMQEIGKGRSVVDALKVSPEGVQQIVKENEENELSGQFQLNDAFISPLFLYDSLPKIEVPIQLIPIMDNIISSTDEISMEKHTIVADIKNCQYALAFHLELGCNDEQLLTEVYKEINGELDEPPIDDEPLPSSVRFAMCKPLLTSYRAE